MNDLPPDLLKDFPKHAVVMGKVNGDVHVLVAFNGDHAADPKVFAAFVLRLMPAIGKMFKTDSVYLTDGKEMVRKIEEKFGSPAAEEAKNKWN